MALGIDSIAHETALERSCLTTAVLGCGIDIAYPPENKKLYERIIENGAVISEFPMGTPLISIIFQSGIELLQGFHMQQ